MKKSYQKCFFYASLTLILNVSHVMSAGGISEEEKSYSDVLPIILMRDADILEIPNDVSLESALIFWEKMDFYAQYGVYEQYFCPANGRIQRNKIKEAQKKSQEKNLETPSVSDNCLFENPIMYLWKILPFMPRCATEPKAIISKLFQTKKKIDDKKGDDEDDSNFEWLSCGFAGENKLYRVGYQIWLESGTLNSETKLDPPLIKSTAFPYKDIIDLEIYRFCYDHTKQEVLYTKHTILSPGLLSNKGLKEDSEKTYPISSLKYDNNELDFQNIEKIHDQVIELEKSNVSRLENSENIPSTSTPKLDYQMEKLIPTDDFSFILWKKPTFHLLNEKLMHKNLSKLWKEINKIIQARAKSARLELDIHTGTFDISDDGVSAISKTGDDIKIPQIWIKIVQHRLIKRSTGIDVNDGIAIIANNHMDDNLEKKIISEYCGDKHTNQYIPPDEPESSRLKKYTYIRSCLVTEKIQNLFGLDLQIENPLELF